MASVGSLSMFACVLGLALQSGVDATSSDEQETASCQSEQCVRSSVMLQVNDVRSQEHVHVPKVQTMPHNCLSFFRECADDDETMDYYESLEGTRASVLAGFVKCCKEHNHQGQTCNQLAIEALPEDGESVSNDHCQQFLDLVRVHLDWEFANAGDSGAAADVSLHQRRGIDMHKKGDSSFSATADAMLQRANASMETKRQLSTFSNTVHGKNRRRQKYVDCNHRRRRDSPRGNGKFNDVKEDKCIRTSSRYCGTDDGKCIISEQVGCLRYPDQDWCCDHGIGASSKEGWRCYDGSEWYDPCGDYGIHSSFCSTAYSYIINNGELELSR